LSLSSLSGALEVRLHPVVPAVLPPTFATSPQVKRRRPHSPDQRTERQKTGTK